MLQRYFSDGVCDGVTCPIADEKCVDGGCKCGTLDHSCAGKVEGEQCDMANDECRCGDAMVNCGEGVPCSNGVCRKYLNMM